MPRYFFHTTNGKSTTDPEGLDLSDDATAQTTAIKLAGELLKAAPDLLKESASLKVDVAAEAGVTLFTVLVTVSHPTAIQNAEGA